MRGGEGWFFGRSQSVGAIKAAGNIVRRNNKGASELVPNYQPNKPNKPNKPRPRIAKAITQRRMGENLPFESFCQYLLLIHIAGR